MTLKFEIDRDWHWEVAVTQDPVMKLRHAASVSKDSCGLCTLQHAGADLGRCGRAHTRLLVFLAALWREGMTVIIGQRIHPATSLEPHSPVICRCRRLHA